MRGSHRFRAGPVSIDRYLGTHCAARRKYLLLLRLRHIVRISLATGLTASRLQTIVKIQLQRTLQIWYYIWTEQAMCVRSGRRLLRFIILSWEERCRTVLQGLLAGSAFGLRQYPAGLRVCADIAILHGRCMVVAKSKFQQVQYLWACHRHYRLLTCR